MGEALKLEDLIQNPVDQKSEHSNPQGIKDLVIDPKIDQNISSEPNMDLISLIRQYLDYYDKIKELEAKIEELNKPKREISQHIIDNFLQNVKKIEVIDKELNFKYTVTKVVPSRTNVEWDKVLVSIATNVENLINVLINQIKSIVGPELSSKIPTIKEGAIDKIINDQVKKYTHVNEGSPYIRVTKKSL